jgi:tRNA A-37 threonylcarbamoyl transferase component Bud32
MYGAAASFVALFLFVVFVTLRGPQDIDELGGQFTGEAMEIRDVLAGTPAERAGFRVGDRVLAIDGQPVASSQDASAVTANMVVGRPQKWEIERRGERVVLSFVPERRTWDERAVGDLTYPLGVGCYLAVALFIALRRPYDASARVGAWFITTASMALGIPTGYAAMWRALPLPLHALLWFPQLSRFTLDGIFLTFALLFPRPAFRARWPWLLIWAPVLATLPWRISWMYRVIYDPGHPGSAPAWTFRATFLRTVAYLMAAIAVLIVNYRRLEDLNERRRIRVLVAGTVVALAAGIVAAWNIQYRGFFLTRGFPVGAALMPLMLLCPIAFAYSILRHRTFDIQVIVRRGLQYGLARGAILGLLPALAVILLVDLAVHRDQTLGAVLWTRGWIYAALAGTALVVYTGRRRWLESLDRRFFREHYDAQRVLREVVEEIRQARSFERVAPRVVARIESALHPEFAALMVRPAEEPAYRSVAVAPAAFAPEPIAAESKLVALVRVLGKPLEVRLSDSGWVEENLPSAEREALQRSRIDLLVPIAAVRGKADALLALGVKRSEEPYSREDRDLLESIAASLSLLLDEPVPEPERVPTAFEECPRCGGCYEVGAARCPEEGEDLTTVQLPRLLAGRYRLEHRRGRGGMGSVYEATDSSLDRRVAVKVIRDDLVGSAVAADRFRREARAAASFAHPNVVTVYDFGVEAGTRAFLVMELLEGVTLREELSRCRRLDAGPALQILREVCAAVGAAHRRQLVHRDLKPENIFLSKNHAGATAKVLDFGLAKFTPARDAQGDTGTLGMETGPGVLLGTAAYISPEQWMGESISPLWDLWALSIVAYEMLTGALPFDTRSGGDWRRDLLAGRFTPVVNHLPERSVRLEAFFARAFAPARAERPSSAAEFLARLEDAAL